MPNHIQNKITIFGNDNEVAKLLNHIKSIDKEGEESQIDFNKITPMPESLNIESGSLGDMAFELLFGAKQYQEDNKSRFSKLDTDRQLESVKLAIQYRNNLDNFGHKTWYEWTIEHWGTKWNAYGQGDERTTDNTVYFQTAWSAPTNLIQKLSKQFPEVEILHIYADEDSGSNTGRLKFKEGKAIEILQPESQSKEGYEIYFELNPDRISDFKLVGDTYEYIED